MVTGTRLRLNNSGVGVCINAHWTLKLSAPPPALSREASCTCDLARDPPRAQCGELQRSFRSDTGDPQFTQSLLYSRSKKD